MHILYVSFDFGWQSSAEGLVGERLVKALLDEGATLTVVTSDFGRSKLTHSRLTMLQVPSWPRHPRRLFHAQLAWRYRIQHMPLPSAPDLVYGRACPLGSILAAKVLAERFDVPLVSHFSDPIPSPWTSPDEHHWASDIKAVRDVIDSSKAVTFTTIEALNWQSEKLKIAIQDKAFVLNHVAPQHVKFQARVSKGEGDGEPGWSFLYAGMLYGRRTADALLAGFRQYVDHGAEAHIAFVGPRRSMVLPVAKRLNLWQTGHVSRFPRIDDINVFLEKANVLVALDADDTDPVFLSVKFIDYASVNRPILLISPKQSPARKLARKMGSSVICSSHDPEEIAEKMACIHALQLTPKDYDVRINAMQSFNGKTVASRLLENLNRL